MPVPAGLCERIERRLRQAQRRRSRCVGDQFSSGRGPGLCSYGLAPYPTDARGEDRALCGGNSAALASRGQAGPALLGPRDISAIVRRDCRAAEDRQSIGDDHLGVSDYQGGAGADPCTVRCFSAFGKDRNMKSIGRPSSWHGSIPAVLALASRVLAYPRESRAARAAARETKTGPDKTGSAKADAPATTNESLQPEACRSERFDGRSTTALGKYTWSCVSHQRGCKK